MPAGQTFRLVRAQLQQQRQFDPNLLSLLLTDSDPLTNGALLVKQAATKPSYLRYQGRQQWMQWPTVPRDSTTLINLDLPDLLPVVAPATTYARYKGRPQQAQWPVQPRLNAVDLELPDLDVLTNGQLGVGQAAFGATYARYKGRPPQAQWPVQPRLDVNSLETTPIDLPDLIPGPSAPSSAVFRYRGRPQWQQGPANDPSFLALPLDIPDLIPWKQTPATMWPLYRGRQVFTRFLPLIGDATNLELADDDVLTNGSIGVDQVALQATFARYKGRPQWQQGPTVDPNLLTAPALDLPDLIPWQVPWTTFQRYKGRPQQAQWPTYPRLNAVDLQLADQDITLLPSWVATTPTYQRYRGRQQQAQGLRLDPRLLEVSTDLPDLIPWQVPWATFLRYRGRPQQSQWPTLPRLNAVDLQLTDLTSPLLVRVDAPSTTYQRYRGRQAWFLQFFPDPNLGVVVSVFVYGPLVRTRRPGIVELSRPNVYRTRRPGVTD